MILFSIKFLSENTNFFKAPMAPLLIKFDLSTSDIILRNQVLTQLLDFVKSQHLLILNS